MDTRMKRIYRLFLGIAFLAFPLQAFAMPFSQMFVLGDSLSDTGNIAIATGLSKLFLLAA